MVVLLRGVQAVNQYTVPICGGLGDTFLRYLLPGACGRIADLRLKEPDSSVRCALMSTTPASADFIRHLFDAVDYEEWDGDYAGFVQRTSGEQIDAGFRWERPEIPLGRIQREIAESLRGRAAIHPFAGTTGREWASRMDLVALVDALCDKGLQVAMLGGSSERIEGDKGAVGRRGIDERFGYERERFCNLVGRGSVSLQAHIAARAGCFIGSFSSYHCAALACDVPRMIVAPRELEPFFAMQHPVYGTLADAAEIAYFGDDNIIHRAVAFASRTLQ